jgi:hypothetical protein
MSTESCNVCSTSVRRKLIFTSLHIVEIMGIDLRIETERGECVAELGDPCNRVNWLLSLGTTDSTFCLQFIDRYGNTVFNSLQLPVLQSEFTGLRSQLTELYLLEAKRVYLEARGAMAETSP